METLKSFLTYHAIEGGLLSADSAQSLAMDAMQDGLISFPDSMDWISVADEVNAQAIASTLAGDVDGGQLIKTSDGYTFAVMSCGTVSDGDLAWPDVASFAVEFGDDFTLSRT